MNTKSKVRGKLLPFRRKSMSDELSQQSNAPKVIARKERPLRHPGTEWSYEYLYTVELEPNKPPRRLVHDGEIERLKFPNPRIKFVSLEYITQLETRFRKRSEPETLIPLLVEQALLSRKQTPYGKKGAFTDEVITPVLIQALLSFDDMKAQEILEKNPACHRPAPETVSQGPVETRKAIYG